MRAGTPLVVVATVLNPFAGGAAGAILRRGYGSDFFFFTFVLPTFGFFSDEHKKTKKKTVPSFPEIRCAPEPMAAAKWPELRSGRCRTVGSVVRRTTNDRGGGETLDSNYGIFPGLYKKKKKTGSHDNRTLPAARPSRSREAERPAAGRTASAPGGSRARSNSIDKIKT